MAISLLTIGSGIDHPEGVCWDPAGFIVVGTEAGALLWLDPDSGQVMRTVDVGSGLMAGIAMDGQGRAYVCDVPGHRVARVDPISRKVETYSRGSPDRSFATPNFPVFGPDGRLYVSDSGTWGANDGWVAVIEAGGVTRLLSSQPSAFTNGLAISPDGSFLYVVESSLPGVSRLRLLPDGRAGPREMVVEMPRHVPDGLAFTAAGSLLISCYRPDVIYTWNDHELAVLAEDWTGLVLSAPTNVAFIGAGLDVLVSANLAGWHLTRIEAGLEGASLHYPHMDASQTAEGADGAT